MRSRTERLHARLARSFPGSARLALRLLALSLVLAACFLALPPTGTGWLGATIGAIELTVPLLLIALVALAAMALVYLALCLWTSHDFTPDDIRAAARHTLSCAVLLWAFAALESCQPAPVSAACAQGALWYLVDQFNQGGLGDAIDVFGPQFSELDGDKLSATSRFLTLILRMLCAVWVLALLLRAVEPIRRRIRLQRLEQWHGTARKVFAVFGWSSVGNLCLWLLTIALIGLLGQEWAERIDESQHGLTVIWRNTLQALLISIPLVAPFVSLGYLMLSALVGHNLSRRELWLSLSIWCLCAAGLQVAVESSVCKSKGAEQAACIDQTLGYVIDQFYKGAFADIFDVYDWKFGGDLPTDDLTVWDQIFTFNFRLLSAVLCVALVAGWINRRTARSTSSTPSPVQADRLAGEWAATQLLSEDDFPATVLMAYSPPQNDRRSVDPGR